MKRINWLFAVITLNCCHDCSMGLVDVVNGASNYSHAGSSRRLSLTNNLLDHLLLVPEHKLMFCWIEKVGCSSFNSLFRSIRSRYDVNQSIGSDWRRNRAIEDHGVDGKSGIESILMDSSWHKAVFFRDPLSRFVSSYTSKCVSGHDGDGPKNCRPGYKLKHNPDGTNESVPTNISVQETLKHLKRSVIMKQQSVNSHNQMISKNEQLLAERSSVSVKNKTSSQSNIPFIDFTTVAMRRDLYMIDNPHWTLQASFCGGLDRSLEYYNTVELFDWQTSRDKVSKLLNKIGIENPSEIPSFDTHFPLSRKVNLFENKSSISNGKDGYLVRKSGSKSNSSEVDKGKEGEGTKLAAESTTFVYDPRRHNTYSGSAEGVFKTLKLNRKHGMRLSHDIIDFYSKDYALFHLNPTT